MAVVQTFRVISEFLSSMKYLGSSSPKDLIIFMTKLVVSPWNWKFLPIYAAKIRLHVRTMWIRRVEPGCHVFTHVLWLRECELQKNQHSEKFRATHQQPKAAPCSYSLLLSIDTKDHSCYLSLARRIVPHTSYWFLFFWCDN